MSKKLYIDLMRIFSEQAPTLRETGGDVKHLQNILEVLDGQLQAGKNKSIIELIPILTVLHGSSWAGWAELPLRLQK